MKTTCREWRPRHSAKKCISLLLSLVMLLSVTAGLDFSAYGFSEEELEAFMLDEAGLWLNQGYIFGKAGRGFVRLNLACGRTV
ncbi:MAG: hypothetical protein IJ927_03790, partial [Eubacterium sp.]|nr:hypothetical protein [Eubacterium sp.]